MEDQISSLIGHYEQGKINRRQLVAGMSSLVAFLGGGSRANAQEQKIAMTIPVFMESSAIDAPTQMGFVMPKAVATEHVPQPASDAVKIQERAGGKYAVYRFAGQMDAKLADAAEEKLRSWMKSRGLVAQGDAELAGYDPPWTPGFLRRNEVLLRLK